MQKAWRLEMLEAKDGTTPAVIHASGKLTFGNETCW